MPEVYLNIGGGRRTIEGFVNIDAQGHGDVEHDVTEGLPYGDASVDGIFSEQFLDRLSQAHGVELLRECRRVLKPGGTLRIALADLDIPVQRYADEDWRGGIDLLKDGAQWVSNRCEMLNLYLRDRDHRWLYNEEELTRLAHLAGLQVLGRRRRSEGADPRLTGLEYHDGSRLIMEFRPVHTSLTAAEEPLVSVLVAAYKPTFFREALDSVLAQTYSRLEVVICDDSADGAIEEAVDAAADPRVRYLRNERRLGGRRNYVKCLSLARGEFVKYLNDDDRLHPACIARLLECFRREPRLRLATSRRKLVDAHGRLLPDEVINSPRVHADSVIEGRSLARLILGTPLNVVGEPTAALLRRDDALQIHPHAFSFGGQEAPGVGDVALWLNLLSRGDCAYLIEPLSDFRLHEGQRHLDAEVRDTTPASWERLRRHAERLGLWRPGSPQALHTRPLAPAVRPSFLGADRHVSDPWDGTPLYEKWIAAREAVPARRRLMRERMTGQWTHRPSIHLLTVVREGQQDALAATVRSLAAQGYPGWGLSVIATVAAPEGLFDGAPNLEWIPADEAALADAANGAIADTGADWVALVEAGVQFPEHALSTFADYINRHPEWRALYCDSDTMDADGRRYEPRFHPDINLELLRATPYLGDTCLLHRATVEALDGLRPLPGAQIYDAVLRLVEQHGEAAVGHIQDVLVHRPPAPVDRRQEAAREAARLAVAKHLRRCGTPARVAPGYLPDTHFIEYPLQARPLVSILLAATHAPEMLGPCLESLLTRTGYGNFEVLVVDERRAEPAAGDPLACLAANDGRVRILRRTGADSRPGPCGYAAGEARGEYLLFLDDATQIIQETWLERMLALGQRPEVGVVGARRVSVEQRVRHGGVILGMDPSASLHRDLPMNEPGYLGRAQATQYLSAVTAPGLLVRRSVYDQAGGVDEERFTGGCRDIDLCLKAGVQGYKVVWTPFATLVHHGEEAGASPSPDEAWALYEKWLPQLSQDPAYNRNLSLCHGDVRVEDRVLAAWEPHVHQRPRIVLIAGETAGPRETRLRAPLQALAEAGQVQALVLPHDGTRRLPEIAELARLAPDVVAIQGPVDEPLLHAMTLYRRFFPHLRLVLDAGDLDSGATGDPRVGQTRQAAVQRLAQARAVCDRLIVASAADREALGASDGDVVVLPDCLERRRWGPLRSERRRAPRPRVGWTGEWRDHEDLARLAEAVEATAEAVDWVFLGFCPPGLRPYASEVYPPADPRDCPAALAALHLDLAVIPAGPGFNEREAGRRLLEYGILGVPVLCPAPAARTLGGAPVSPVADTPAGWIAAILARAADPDTAARDGDALRAWVADRRMLEDHLDRWRAAFCDPRRPPVERGTGSAAPELAPSPDPCAGRGDAGAASPEARDEPGAPAPPEGGDYAAWCAARRLTEADAQLMAERMLHQWQHAPAVHLIAVIQPGQEALLAETVADLSRQLYRGWGLTVFAATSCPEPSLQQLDNIEWIEAEGDVTARVNRATKETGADWVALLEAGDRLEPHLLFACVDHINRHPGWRMLYVDEDTIDGQGRRYDPCFKPDFNPDLLRSTPYVGSFCLFQREALEQAGGWIACAGMENYHAAFRILETCGEEAVGHVAEMLHHRRDTNRRTLLSPEAREAGRRVVADHLARCGQGANVSAGLLPGSYVVDYLHDGHPPVSIIIPSRDRARPLQACVESVLTKTAYPNFEIVVVDNGSETPDALAYLEALEAHPRVRVHRYPHAYSGSAMRNGAVRACSGEYLLFLDDDLVVVQAQWLDRMLGHARRAEVGVVGARVVHTDQTIEHAGLVLGMGSNGVAGRPYCGMPMGVPGMMGRAQLVQNYSAVDGACLLIRRSVFEQAGGLDGALNMAYYDVDLCLKVRQAGYSITWTPFATVARCGAGRLGPPSPPDAGTARRELTTVLERWLPQLARDPAYNRHLSLMDHDCRPEGEIDVPWDPQVPGTLRVLGGGLGYGSLHYRIGEPLGALRRHARARVGIIPSHHDRLRMPSITELERAAPDTLVLHNGIHEVHLEMLDWYRRFNDVFTVFGQDDLIFDVPEDHPLHHRGCPDAEERLRTALSRCDRLIVTTEALADAHRHLIDDIRVIPNYLDPRRWEHLRSQRCAGPRPRVGWAGAQQHQGDLRLLIKVVEATAGEVDWIFFGMCPDELLPLVTEFHPAVPYERYPDALARLNLDVAVAPLALNRFNECKSNLRLLEYGVLGWPVVCSDIEPYRNAPVQRVPNHPEAWIDAVMDRARDLNGAAREGDRLRAWVRDNWMLDDHLEEWLDGLSPGAAGMRRQAPVEARRRPDAPRAASRSDALTH